MNLYRELRILKFLQGVTLVVLMFLALAVAVQGAEYEQCYTIEEGKAKTVSLGNYRIVVVDVKQALENEASFRIAYVNRFYYSNHMKEGDSFELPEYNFDLVNTQEGRAEFCFAEKVLEDNKVENKKEVEKVDNKVDQDSDLISLENIEGGNIIFEEQNPQVESKLESWTRIFSAIISQGYSRFF